MFDLRWLITVFRLREIWKKYMSHCANQKSAQDLWKSKTNMVGRGPCIVKLCFTKFSKLFGLSHIFFSKTSTFQAILKRKKFFKLFYWNVNENFEVDVVINRLYIMLKNGGKK